MSKQRTFMTLRSEYLVLLRSTNFSCSTRPLAYPCSLYAYLALPVRLTRWCISATYIYASPQSRLHSILSCLVPSNPTSKNNDRSFILLTIVIMPANRGYFGSRPATITLFTAVFLASDYFWYRQDAKYVKSVVWSRVLGSAPRPHPPPPSER